jgi:hypothetical protein
MVKFVSFTLVSAVLVTHFRASIVVFISHDVKVTAEGKLLSGSLSTFHKKIPKEVREEMFAAFKHFSMY